MRMMRTALFTMAALMAAAPSHARQTAVLGPGDACLPGIIGQAASIIQQGDADDLPMARQALDQLVTTAPGCYSPQFGAAAYWLGLSYERAGDEQQAVVTWRTGYDALAKQGRYDVRLADALLGAVTLKEGHQDKAKALQVYTDLMGQVGRDVQPWEEPILLKYVVQLRPMLSDEAFQQVVAENGTRSPQRWVFRDDAGTYLSAWWRRQDPLPATLDNERIDEHIQRVVYAEKHYPSAETPDGYDDRGRIYVQYGRPLHKSKILFNDAGFFKDVFRFGVHINLGDFPDNEIWTYDHIGDFGKYLFLEDGAEFRLGDTVDLIPPQMKYGFNNSDRAQNKAFSTVAAMHYIYEKLTQEFSGEYAPLFNQIDDYLSIQDELEFIVELKAKSSFEQTVSVGASRTIEDGTEDNAIYARPGRGLEMPVSVAQKTVALNRETDRQLAIRREREMPKHHTEALEEIEDLPVALRTARFLDDDGTTRTEIYWSALHDALHLPRRLRKAMEKQQPFAGADQYLINFSVLQQTPDFRNRVVHRKRYFLDRSVETESGVIEPQTYTVEGDTGAYHLAMEWDQHLVVPMPTGKMAASRLLKAGVQRLDSLHALRSDPTILEMSDVRPMIIEPEKALTAADPVAEARVQPFLEITPDTPLLLYFELYHLTFGTDDQTHYKVAYEVSRHQKGGLLQLLSRRGEQRTITESPYTGDSRTVKDYILIELGDWERQVDSQLQVTLRVTDETTGQQVARTVQFKLLPPLDADAD